MDFKTAQAKRRGVLTDKQVKTMRSDYHPYQFGYERLAKKYNCAISTARDICTYRTRINVF